MSVARVYTTQKVRKDWTCGKCGDKIRKGIDGRLSYAVGFRGVERTRCLKPECYPQPSERESSLVATVLAAQEGVDFSNISSLDEIEEQVQNVVDACEEVAGEYEQNEMYEINEDLQERAQMIESAGEELSSWSDSLESEPEEDDFDDSEEYDTAHNEWLEAAAEAAQEAINNMDLP